MEIKTKCGVFGLFSTKKEPLDIVIDGINKLQHRGRESCGISYLDNGEIITRKTLGIVPELVKKYDFNKNTKISVAHVRYSTSGSKSSYDVIQPKYSEIKNFSLVHNGNIPNIEALKKYFKLDVDDDDVKAMNDTAMIQWILENSESIEEGLNTLLWKIPGAYSLIIMCNDSLYCIRDSHGYKPLCYSNIGDNCFLVASESVAISKFYKNCSIYDVLPGQILKIDSTGVNQLYKLAVNPFQTKICSFEYIYFMNYKTISDGILVDDVRYKIGEMLAKRDTIKYPKNTIVIGSPNSGISYGKSYAKQSKILYVQALKKIKKERTFILPTNGQRINKIKKIITVDSDLVVGREVILVDDSIVRGNTIKHIIDLLRKNGALKVHVKIAYPKIISPCYYGIDFPTYDELVGHNKSEDEIKEIIGSDSLQYTKPEDIIKIIKTKNGMVCNSCSTDEHDLKKYDW